MNNPVKKQSYTLIDCMKLLLAFLILFSHFLNEHGKDKLPRILDLSVSVYIIAVPMYFAFSGYFLFKKIYSSNPAEHTSFIKNYCLKTMRLYGIWSLIYITFKLITWVRFTPSGTEVWSYIHHALVYSTYNTIWFLPATAVGAVLALLLRRLLGDKGMFWMALVFCVIGAMGDSYFEVTKQIPVIGTVFTGYKSVFVTTRNGIFNGFPYIAVGAMAAYKQKKDTAKYSPVFNRYFFASVLFAGAFITEAFISKILCDAHNSNTILMLFPFTYCAVYWCIISRQPGISQSASLTVRRMSTAIFLSQRLFLSALPELFPGSVFAAMLKAESWVAGLCWVTACTVLFSAVLLVLSSKYGVFKKLYE